MVQKSFPSFLQWSVQILIEQYSPSVTTNLGNKISIVVVFMLIVTNLHSIFLTDYLIALEKKKKTGSLLVC